MNRDERRRQKREEKKRGKFIGVLFGGPSPSILPMVHQFIGEHEGHMFFVDDDLKNSLTLHCVYCDDDADLGEG